MAKGKLGFVLSPLDVESKVGELLGDLSEEEEVIIFCISDSLLSLET